MRLISTLIPIILIFILLQSCEEKPTIPVIATNTVTGVTTTAAVSGGVISGEGGAAISSKGVCWNSSENPTTENFRSIENVKSTSFTSNLSQLIPNTLYYVRAYATNSSGTGYGNQVSFKTLSLPPDKPGGIRIVPGNYSLTITWDNASNQAYKNVKIFRDTVSSPTALYREITYTNKFEDLIVALDTRYFYKISVVDLNGQESVKSDEVSGIPIVPINTAIPINGEIGGIHYAYWNFPTPTFTKIIHNFTIFNEPVNKDNSLNKDGLYYQFYQGIINDTIGFYYGIQTSVMKPDGVNKKGVIFSRWKTRDISNYKIAPGGWGQSAGYEGDFIGVRKNYDWGVGTYKIELRKDTADTKGDWYSLWINKVPNGIIEYIGSIRFERSTKSSGIKDGGITWTELYYKANTNTPLPYWHVSVNEVLADNKKPIHVTSSYNQKTFVGFSNIFTTNSQDVHFLMGPTVLRFHGPGLLW